MDGKAHQEARFALRRAMQRHGLELAALHRWLYEGDRWKELAFALLTRTTSLPERCVRDIVDDLEELGMLDVKMLADMPVAGAELDLHEFDALHIRELLIQGGFREDEALKGLKTLWQTARGLSARFGGKLQRYLRHYGELMLAEIPELFDLTELDQAAARGAFTYWLQNVLDMPLSLVDENVQRFCAQHDITPAELFATADELNIDLAFVDDLAACEVAQLAGSETREQEIEAIS